MIRPGTNLCRVCGEPSSIHFYRTGRERQGAQLKWNSEQGKYVLEAYTGNSRSVMQTTQKSFMLQEFLDKDFPPQCVSAVIGTELQPTRLYRSCPHCTEHEIFPPDMGKVPCFVVAVVGAKTAGKTAWLGALPNALEVLSWQKFPYKIEPWKLGADQEYSKSTTGYEDGNTNYFTVIDKKTEKTVAILYLMDYAGELYDNQKIEPDSPLGKIFLGNSGAGYPGLDAVIFIEPAVSDKLNNHMEGADQVVGVIGEYRDYLRGRPIARVCTFADKLIEEESKHSSQRVPIITENTFPRTVYSGESKNLIRYYTPEAIVRRIHLQDYIADQNVSEGIVGRRLRYLFGGNEDYYSFLVQSCVHIPGEEKGSNDYKLQFNVADPLIWILYRLGLFPLKLEGENEN